VTRRLVIGLDLGTQSCKAVACDDALRVLGAHAIAYPTEHPEPDRAEQDPLRWDAALAPAIGGALAAAGAAPGDVAALAIAGQLDGCVAVDGSGEPLHRALIWQDRRAVAEAALPTIDRARVFAITGQVADASHLAPKLSWLRARGVRAATYHQPTSYLVARLTGARAIDRAHASTTMLYDLAAGAWSRELCDAYAIDPLADLPALRDTCAIVGALHERGAALCGLPAGTPVAVGTGDDFATPLGAGLAAPGPIACALGTAEVVGAISDAPVLDRVAPEPMVETHAFPTGAYFVENPGWLSGGAVRWAVQLLGLPDDAALDRLAEAAPPGAAGVVFVPALAGAMTPAWRPHARGALYGLAAGHDRAHVARAVLEGLAFACRDVAERLAAMGVARATDGVVVLGGGGRSAAWLQIRADALGAPHHVAARADSCAVGAAMIAAVAAGLAPDLAAAAARAEPAGATFRPQRSLDDAYARYRRAALALAPLADARWA
jgi:xylulokinase